VSESRENLDEGPVSKALATAALALGLQFGQQANAEEVYVFKDAQGELKAVQQANEVPANTEYSFVVDTDTKKINFLNKPNAPKPEPTANRNHISSNTFTSGIDDVQYSRHGVESNNIVTMDFPYKAHKGRLIVQDSGGKRLLALYVSGQITGKDMKIKIDNYPTLKNIISQGQKPSTGIIGSTFWEEPWRHGNNQNFFEAFLTPEEKAELDRIMKAGPNYGDGSGPKQNTRGAAEKHNLLHNAWQRIKHEGQTMKVEVNLYQRGPVVYEFNISQLFKSGGGNKAHTPKTVPSSSGDPKSNPVVNAGGISVVSDEGYVYVSSSQYSKLQKGDRIDQVHYRTNKLKMAYLTDGDKKFKQFVDKHKGKEIIVYGKRAGRKFVVALKL
jgi:hypothetical protein